MSSACSCCASMRSRSARRTWVFQKKCCTVSAAFCCPLASMRANSTKCAASAAARRSTSAAARAAARASPSANSRAAARAASPIASPIASAASAAVSASAAASTTAWRSATSAASAAACRSAARSRARSSLVAAEAAAEAEGEVEASAVACADGVRRAMASARAVWGRLPAGDASWAGDAVCEMPPPAAARISRRCSMSLTKRACISSAARCSDRAKRSRTACLRRCSSSSSCASSCAVRLRALRCSTTAAAPCSSLS
eukprot:scaffold8531_cov62-Phaeocystis_antarctica.AAC.13